MDFSLINESRDTDRVVLDYIQSLFEIEMLQEINFKDVTLFSAIEFGIASGAPWKGDVEYSKQFKNNHKENLVKYNICKTIKLLLSLFEKSRILDTEVYHDVPMEPSLANSITRCLENINTKLNDRHVITKVGFTGDKTYGYDASYIHSRFAEKNPNLENSTDFYDLIIASRILDSIYNNFTGDHRDLDTDSCKKFFGQHRHETLDNKTYIARRNVFSSLAGIHRCVQEHIRIPTVDTTLLVTTFWSSLFKVLFKLRLPYSIHPNRLDRLYEKYIMRDQRYAEGVSLARRYSLCEPVDVLDNTYLQVNPENVFENDETHHLSIGNYFPGSLVEKYLVVKYLNK